MPTTISNVPIAGSDEGNEPERTAEKAELRSDCPDAASATIENDVTERSEKRKKRKTSIYRGVFVDNYSSVVPRFSGSVYHYDKKYKVGWYELETDVALATDGFRKAVKGRGCYTNFPSFESYVKARETEIENRGENRSDHLTIEDVLLKIRDCLERKQLTTEYLDQTLSVLSQPTINNQNLKSNVNLSPPKKTAKPTTGNDKSETSADATALQCSEPAASANYECDSLNESSTTNLTSPVAESSKKQPHQSDKKKTSIYRGVHLDRSTAVPKFLGSVHVGQSKHKAGFHVLETDAALATDELRKALKGNGCYTNFSSFECFLKARAMEIENRGGTSLDHVTIETLLFKIRARLEKKQLTTAHFDETYSFLPPPTNDNPKSDAQSDMPNTSDENTNVSDEHLSQQKEKTKPNVVRPSWVELNPNKTNNLPFPIGCIVNTKFQRQDTRGEYFKEGILAKVTNAYLDINSRDIFYITTSNNDNSSNSVAFNERELAYSPNCSIKYCSSRPFNDDKSVEGKISFIQTKPRQMNLPQESTMPSQGNKNKVTDMFLTYYTIVVFPNGPTGSYEVIEDVASDQLKYNGDLTS